MWYVYNFLRLLVFEQFFSIALEVNILELDANKIIFCQNSGAKTSSPSRWSVRHFRRVLALTIWPFFRWQREFLDCLLENDRLTLILASATDASGYYSTDLTGLVR